MTGTKTEGFRRLMWDISGAFGDIGVLFPLAIVLIAQNGFHPTSLFLMAGLFYTKGNNKTGRKHV